MNEKKTTIHVWIGTAISVLAILGSSWHAGNNWGALNTKVDMFIVESRTDRTQIKEGIKSLDDKLYEHLMNSKEHTQMPLDKYFDTVNN